MRLDMIQTKTYKQEQFKHQMIVIAMFSCLLGLLPIGFYFLLPCLLYCYMREDQTKYFVMFGFLLGSTYQGGTTTLHMAMMIIAWNAMIQLANFSTYHFVEVLTLLGLFVSGLYGYAMDVALPYHMALLLFQAIGSYLILSEFYKDKQVLDIMAMMITVLVIVFVLKQYTTLPITLLVMNGVLVYIIGFLDQKKGLFIILLAYLFLSESLSMPPTSIPLLLVLCLSGQAKWKKIILYLIACYALQQSIPVPYYIAWLSATTILLGPNKKIAEKGKSEYDGKTNGTTSAMLLHQFSSIFKELSTQNHKLSMLGSIADVFSYCGDELSTTSIKERQIKQQVEEVLQSYQYRVSKISVEKIDTLLLRLHIHKMHHSELETMIVPLLSKAVGIPLHVLSYQKTGFFDSFHFLELASERGLSLQYDMCQQGIDGICGDAMKVKLSHEKMIFMMSDGMGSGPKAKQQSTFALSIVEKLMDAQVPLKTTIKLVNQLALLQEEERYATLDILSIDRFKREATLYKSGTVQTYLMRDKTVYAFTSESLPLGIIERINPEFYVIPLCAGDDILLVSDGGDHEQMKDWIKALKQKNCSRMLQELFDRRRQERVDDDISMMLVCLKDGING